MNKKEIVNNEFQNLMNIVNESNNKKLLKINEEKEIIEEKRKILLPIAEFLTKVRDNGINVYPAKYLIAETPTEKSKIEPVLFKFFQGLTEASDYYKYVHPSPILFVHNPARIEVTVVNDYSRKREGLIRITCVANHPDNHIFKDKKFEDISDALKALTEFLGKNAVGMNRKQY